ncbi:uncharacterized protein KY384_007181 [Bacidia gigantensis]|uniref:uncharacterized protein n=1 Tax=Bacidia gigantensis TaxID=2732470 RepID=UPI001D0397D0|nr:uncharacterized protein KY384_007181 [Bacidia gigantensis]KAG8528264.1 hypothetical protein KY384_007181 [Bacidia gigantensis]
MLRVGPSKISLEARDLKWHQANIQRRLSKRAHEAGLYTKATVTNDPDLNLQAERSLTIPARAPLTPPTPPTEVGEEDDDEDIISKKPIPPESSKYWEQIVADAGVSGSVENISAEPSISLKHARQSRTASSATTLSNSLNDSDQENQVTGEKPHEGPSRSSGSLKSSHFHQVDAESLASKQIRKFAKRSLFPSFRHRKPWNFDGPYETMSRASAPIQDETGEDLHDDLYGDYHDRRTFSTSWQTFESEQSNRSARRQMSTTSVTGSHPSLPSLFSPGLLSQPPRRRRNMTYRPPTGLLKQVENTI